MLNKTTQNIRHRGMSKFDRQAILMLSPQILGFVLFTLYPILWVIRLAWYDYDGITLKFIGFDNFIRVFTRDPLYWKSILNTIILSFGKLAIELPLALILAVFLNEKWLKGKSFLRTMFFLPNIVSPAIIGLIFGFIFSTFNGFVNEILMHFQAIDAPINWFSNKWLAMLVIMIASIWQGFGINMLFFLSGLLNIPQELYEAADVDGANVCQKFVHVTLPLLAPVMRVICMLAILGSMKISDLVLVLTNGQPAGGTEVVMTYIFKNTFAYGNMSQIPQIGYSACLGLVTSIIIGLITLYYNHISKKATM